MINKELTLTTKDLATSVKTRHKSEQKRDNILTAASELFCENGFSATSMDQVAKQAGVSKQTVYSHFGNKDDLFCAAISCRCQNFRMSALSEEMLGDPLEALQTFAKGFMSLIMSKEGLAIHRICTFEAQINPHISQLFYKAGPEPMIAELSQILAKYNQLKLVNIEDCECAAIQFLSLIKGEAMMRLEYNTPKQLSTAELNDYINKSVNLFLRGYGYRF